jgi:hypothetical protein
VTVERRRAPRLAYVSGILPPTASILPSGPIVVVNLSAVGMLVEAGWHVRPSRLVEARLRFGGTTVTVLAEIVRAYVSRIDARRGLRYRAALAFATRIAVPIERDLLESCRRTLACSR